MTEQLGGHCADVLLYGYAKCIAGQDAGAKRRILEATQPAGTGHGEDKPDGHQDGGTPPR